MKCKYVCISEFEPYKVMCKSDSKQQFSVLCQFLFNYFYVC